MFLIRPLLREAAGGAVGFASRQGGGDGGGGLGFAFGVSAGDGDVHERAGGEVRKGEGGLAFIDDDVRDFHTVGVLFGGDAVALVAAAVVKVDDEHPAVGRAGRDGDVLRDGRRAGIGGLVEAEGVPAFVVVGDDLFEFVAQVGERGVEQIQAGEVGLLRVSASVLLWLLALAASLMVWTAVSQAAAVQAMPA